MICEGLFTTVINSYVYIYDFFGIIQTLLISSLQLDVSGHRDFFHEMLGGFNYQSPFEATSL